MTEQGWLLLNDQAGFQYPVLELTVLPWRMVVYRFLRFGLVTQNKLLYFNKSSVVT